MIRGPGRDNSFIWLLVLLLFVWPLLSGGNLFNRRDPHTIAAILISFIIATAIHEFMHAFTALKLGDDTAERLGRITLNPIAHFEPIGFLGMVLIALGFGAIGWGKPVPVNPNNFGGDIRRRRLYMGLVALAGPVSNLVQAAIVAGIVRLLERNGTDLGTAGFYLSWYVWVNLLLAAFNFIPIPPLDGSKILSAILPNFWYPILAPIEQYGFMILLLLIFLGDRFGGSILTALYAPVFNSLWNLIGSNGLLRYLGLYQ